MRMFDIPRQHPSDESVRPASRLSAAGCCHWHQAGARNGGEQQQLARIDQLRRTIAAGTYSISAGTLADCLLQSMRERGR